VGAVGDPVNTVVDNESATAARGSPAAGPVLDPPTSGLLDTPDETLDGPDDLDASVDRLDGGAPDSAAANGATEDRATEDRAPGGAGREDAARQEPEQGYVRVNGGKSVNLGPDGQPPDGDGRPIEVTAILSETAILPEIAPADEALAPDPFATSAFDAEELRKPAVWAAADVVTEIYHGHYKQLVRLAVLLVHDVQTAEEVVQDAFEAMHLASRRLRDSEKALQYLRQTVVNRSRSVLRHRKVVDMHAPKPGPDEPSAEHAALAILERSAVAAALRTLPERQREAIALRYYADFSEADIAQAMGISKGAVKSHTARAMASLKTILTRETS
jgi:RNA polymerase sigma-70 factor (sigma-E family)